MEETHKQLKFFGFLQTIIYIFIFINIYLVCIFQPTNNQVATKLITAVVKLHFLHEIYFNHIVILIMVIAVAFATKARKNIDYNINKHFITPFFIGLFLFVTSLLYPFNFIPALRGLPSTIFYASFYIIGTVLLHTSLSNLSKILGTKVKEDIWNIEQQSFEQNRTLVKGDYLINIPMQFYYKKKWHDGWININVFRALMVLGVPGSGKTESIIIPYIKQLLSMGYTMLVYDFKYPDLAEITYYHYLKNKQHNGPLKNHQFHVINVDQLEQSRRVNPILPKYIETLSDASETAEAMVLALKKGASSSGGSDQFFTLSAINLLGASIYYFSKYENGKYCTIPHVLAFLNLPYDRLFETLFKMQEIQSLLSPFRTAYQNKAFEQLEGQVGTLKVQLSRLVTKETFWIFSGNDIDLKISNPPAILILANSDRTQNTNSAFYSSLLMRTLKQINSKDNYPSAIIIDETPTVFLHKIENVIATARSMKVAVCLGLQELTQFRLNYSKEVADTITSIMGSVLSGNVRSKDTLTWLQEMFGKIKQVSNNISIDRNRTNVSINEKMDSVIPSSRITNLNAGEMVGVVSKENTTGTNVYSPNMFNCKIKLDFKQIEEEKKHYLKTPIYYDFGTPNEKSEFLTKNMEKIIKEVEQMA